MKAVSWGGLGKQCWWSMQALQEVAAEILKKKKSNKKKILSIHLSKCLLRQVKPQ